MDIEKGDNNRLSLLSGMDMDMEKDTREPNLLDTDVSLTDVISCYFRKIWTNIMGSRSIITTETEDISKEEEEVDIIIMR